MISISGKDNGIHDHPRHNTPHPLTDHDLVEIVRKMNEEHVAGCDDIHQDAADADKENHEQSFEQYPPHNTDFY